MVGSQINDKPILDSIMSQPLHIYMWITRPRPTDGISIEFEIRSTFGVLYFKMFSVDHNKILHTSLQLYCRDVYKILLWSVESVLNQNASILV